MPFAWHLNQDMFVDLTEAERKQLITLLGKLFESVRRF
jgi:hypothetical protein